MRALETPMPRITILLAALASIFAVATICSTGPDLLMAQSAATTSSSPTQLTDQETRGENLFRQRCSICHLPRKLKFGSPPVIGPDLSGLFKEANPDKQKLLKATILKGSPDMPGFQYGLEPKEIDDLIAFLKTL